MGSTKTRKPARNVPLPMSTTNAAARGAATKKHLFLPLFTSPLRRERGLIMLTQELRSKARNRLLHLRLLPLLLTLLLLLLLLLLLRQPPPLSPPHPLHLFRRLESHLQDEVNRGVVHAVATTTQGGDGKRRSPNRAQAQRCRGPPLRRGFREDTRPRSAGDSALAPWSVVLGAHLDGVVGHRGQRCSDRQLLVLPPRALSSLPPPHRGSSASNISHATS